MSRRNIEAVYPLSPMQQGMLFHSIYDPDTRDYFEQLVLKLRGDLDIEAFNLAWRKVIDRNPILRTAFSWKSLDQMVQVVHLSVDFKIDMSDWQNSSKDQQDQKLRTYLVKDRQEGFDPSTAPLLRLALFQTNKDEYYYVQSHHHILLDGWSMPLLLKEVLTLYEANRNGQYVELSPVRPYREYINWIYKQDKGKAEKYWRDTLAGFSAPTQLLVSDRNSSVITDKELNITETGEVEFELSPSMTTRLNSLSVENRVTSSTLIQAAWALLLSRYSGEDDVLFGVTVSGRPPGIPDVESMIGLFINTLPLRLTVPRDLKLSDWLQSLQNQTVNMRQYEYSSLVDIQTWSQIPSGLSMFDSIIVFENYPVDKSVKELESSLKIEKIASHEQTNYPLTVIASPSDRLSIKLSYDRQVFSDFTATMILGHLKTVLESFARNPHQLVGEVEYITKGETEQLLYEWNQTELGDPENQNIQQLFEAQVENTPERVALKFVSGSKEEILSYADLNRRVNCTANYLRKIGVGPEILVGIFFERSIDLIVGILGVIKAGGIYVPLSPNFPDDRISYMIDDTDLPIILTHEHLEHRLSQGERLVICLDRDWDVIAQGAQTNPVNLTKGNALAYVIYTSGSTGLPKGVMVHHKGLANFTLAMKERYSLVSEDRVLQFMSTGFDASATEIYPTLLSGATLVLIESAEEILGSNIIRFCQQENITILHLPTAVWHYLVDDLDSIETNIETSLRLLEVGGESVDIRRFQKWTELLESPIEFINAYGPTEATVATTLYKTLADQESATEVPSVPIGQILPNVKLYVLDRNMQPVPIGVPGELYIGGAGVARGYLNRPELTAEYFIPDPYTYEAGSRLYRTGDFVKYLPDRNLEFIGRQDNQIKLRGFRVELGEIESILAAHPLVNQCVVILWENDEDQKNLVAYLTPKDKDGIDTLALRNYMREVLPDYMVPASLVVLKELPLLPNGKIDRKALEKPDIDQVRPEVTFVAPRSPVETMLAEIWTQVLGLERIGINDNFFILGGHSLLATQVVSRIRNVMEVEIPIRDLFENPTITDLAERVEILTRETSGLEYPPLEPLPRNPETGVPDGVLMTSFAQQRLWFLDQLSPGNLFYNIPIAVQLTGDLDVSALEKSLNEIARRHASLRTTFQNLSGKPVQVISPPGWIDLPVDDLSSSPAEQRTEIAHNLVIDEARKPFDLERGPLFRVRLIKMKPAIEADPAEYIFIIVMHHIISDGWSLGIFINEIATLYTTYSEGYVSPLPDLKVQYFDFANWQRKWLDGEALQRQMEYWRNQLSSQPKILSLPTDRPRPAIQSSVGDTFPFSLSKSQTDSVKNFCKKENVTLFMFLLAVYQTLLYRYSDQDDVSVGTAIANRTMMDTEAIIGFFVNTLVMRTDLSGRPSVKELMSRVRNVTLGAFAHQDLPFELLVEELQPDRDLSHTPLFQVAFALQNTPTSDLDKLDPSITFSQSFIDQDEMVLQLPDLELKPIVVDSGTAKFDMTLSMSDSREGLVGAIEYNTDLFDRETIRQMADHFKNLLLEFIESPDQIIDDIEFLTEYERSVMLGAWNQTEVDTPISQCAHWLFEGKVDQFPNAIAVTFDGDVLSYAELNSRANQLAHYLRGQSVEPETIVGISTQRSIEMVVAILGVQKAGGAYLPIDPTYPEDRIEFMLRDSRLKVLLTQANILPRLPINKLEQEPIILCLDTEWEQEISALPTTNVHSDVVSENIAYVIYTSGSTGLPKGTMLRHNGLSNLAEAQRLAFGIALGSRILQFSPLSFDASVWETFMALANGATLCLAKQEVLASGIKLADLLSEQAITNVTLPPSVLRVLPQGEFPALSTVIAAGEACTPDLVERWAPERDFFNAYGPTETTVCASMYLCDENDTLPPPIGRPIANTKLYILDEKLFPLPVGVPGELHVSGVSVARGYLRRPEMTAQKFVPDPFSSVPGSRLYKTGDLVRYRRDGNIEFLGRIDQQVKVRGFRIELGEVENALNDSPLVREGVVVAREDVPGDTRLVAYVVRNDMDSLGGENGFNVAEVRSSMRNILPEYMVPSIFIVLDELPYTPSGKVDKRALPPPDTDRPVLESVYVAPRTEIEKFLVRISEELLGIEKVGINDNFFELGGHSLLATQFISRVREDLGVELELRQFFETPTVAELGQAVEDLKSSAKDDRARISELLARINELSDEEVKELLALRKKTAEKV